MTVPADQDFDNVLGRLETGSGTLHGVISFRNDPNSLERTVAADVGHVLAVDRLARQRRYACKRARQRHPAAGLDAEHVFRRTSLISGANVGFNPGAAWHVVPPHHDLV